MSSNGQTTEGNTPARRAPIRVRVDRLRQSRQRSIIGMAELVGLAGSAVMLLAVIFTYLYFFSPAQSRLATAQLERDRYKQCRNGHNSSRPCGGGSSTALIARQSAS